MNIASCFCLSGTREQVKPFIYVINTFVHISYVAFSALWFASYKDISSRSDFKVRNFPHPHMIRLTTQNYGGTLDLPLVEGHLLAIVILSSVVLFMAGVSFLADKISHIPSGCMMNGFIEQTILRWTRFSLVFLTISLYTIDTIFWNEIRPYGLSMDFFQNRGPQIATLISAIGISSMYNYIDHLSHIYAMNDVDHSFYMNGGEKFV